jgi:uncharacterized protein (DUF1501 family)
MRSQSLMHERLTPMSARSRGLSRRIFLGSAAAALGVLALPRAVRGEKSDDPHFFLQVVIEGGMDPTYLFDARPLEMTAAGLQHNYLGQEPTEWVGENGGRTLIAAPAEVVRPFQADVALVNGVIMSNLFDGHTQNMNILLTGNPFGGSSFISRFNVAKPVDYLRIGDVEADVTDGRFAPLTPATARELQASLQGAAQDESAADAYLNARYAKAAGGTGRFSAGSQALRDALSQSRVLTERMRTLELPSSSDDEMLQTLGLIKEYFRSGMVQSALINLTRSRGFDAHDPATAKAQVSLYPSVGEDIVKILSYLKTTAFDQKRSLFDVTTVMFASEFGRTMRHAGRPIDDTGTDHNPLANSVLLAGKGIRGGVVVGGTDFQSSSETLSSAHLALDPSKLKVMGRPVDFATGRVTAEAPVEYQPQSYLTIASLVNALYELLGVDKEHYWQAARNEGTAPVLAAILR